MEAALGAPLVCGDGTQHELVCGTVRKRDEQIRTRVGDSTVASSTFVPAGNAGCTASAAPSV